MAVYASSVIDAEDLTRRLPKMGAVKTNRKRWVTDWKYKTFAWWERRKKLAKYIRMQNISNIKDTNNRRKMAGLPMIRRAKS
jgi:hypothetical protein